MNYFDPEEPKASGLASCAIIASLTVAAWTVVIAVLYVILKALGR